MSNPVLVEVLRGDALESAHSGAFAVLDADGTVLASLGDIHRPIFPRSAVKVLQALPLVASGAADRLQLSDAELAIACASHNGEPEHVATALGMLKKAGLDERALECGTQWPARESVLRGMFTRHEQAGPLHNNCSGKHAGFVCLACQLAIGQGSDPGEFAHGYIKPDHPVMREVSAALAAATDTDLSRMPVGTDGCSIPTYAIPLRQLALAFARVGTGQGLSPERAKAAQRLRQAVASAPFMVGGTARFDTQVMAQLGERVFCKIGAEGVYCASFPELGLGVALKIDDGTARGAEVAMAALIESLLPLGDADQLFMRTLSTPELKNWNGINVGSMRASAALRRAAAR
jgi:L-asparaginase II